MGGNTTHYDIMLRYRIEDKASIAQTRQLVDQTRMLARESKAAGIGLGRLGAAAAGVFGVRQAYSSLIGFNAQVQDTKTQIAGMLALAKHTDFADEVGRADALYASLQKRAASLPGTTQEYVTMAGMLTQPITDAGLGLKVLEDLTVNAAVGAKALRVEAGAAARDIDQALRGQFHSNDVFTGKILGAAGFKGEEGRAKYNALSDRARADTLKNALMTKQLTQMAEAQGGTFSGSLSTLQDTVEQFAGKIGAPLFKAITVELKRWNVWLTDNQAKVDAFAERLAHGLVTGFSTVKSAISFLVDHADLLLTIGKVWAAVKIGGMIGGGMAGIGGSGAGGAASLFGAGGFFRGWSDKMNDKGEYESVGPGRGRQSVGGLKGLAENAGIIAQAGALGVALGSLAYSALDLRKNWAGAIEVNGELLDVTDRATAQYVRLQRSMDSLDEATQRAAKTLGFASAASNQLGAANEQKQQANLVRDAFAAYQQMQSSHSIGSVLDFQKKKEAAEAAGIGWGDILGAGGPKQFIDQKNAAGSDLQQRALTAQGMGSALFLQAFTSLSTDEQKSIDIADAQLRVLEAMVKSGNKLNANDAISLLWSLIDQSKVDANGKTKMSNKPTVNVTIQRIEVQSDDPDRYAFGLVEAFRDVVRNPGEAVSRAKRAR